MEVDNDGEYFDIARTLITVNNRNAMKNLTNFCKALNNKIDDVRCCLLL